MVRPEVAAWHTGGREPVTRRTVSLNQPATVQTWRLVGYTDPAGNVYTLDDPEAASGLLPGLWVLDDEEHALCACSHGADVHTRHGRGGGCARAACGCAVFRWPAAPSC